ncbi:MAG: hypothetical protein K6E72_06650 [Saccharofermentans sp.]|nr:hypothetical protein [Saccharofermentans sp.]
MDPRSICKAGHRTSKAPGGSKYRRLLAGTMVIVVLVTVLFSIAYIAIESGHDCCGEDCHICASIRECEKNIPQLRAEAGKSTNASTISFIAFLIITVIFLETAFIKESPVSSKIRLNI